MHMTPTGLPFHRSKLIRFRCTITIFVGPDEGFRILWPTLATTRAPGAGTCHISTWGCHTTLDKLVNLKVESALSAAVEKEPATNPSDTVDQTMTRTMKVCHTGVKRIPEAVNSQSIQ